MSDHLTAPDTNRPAEAVPPTPPAANRGTRGTPGPGTPAPGTPGPGTPAPGTPGPGNPASQQGSDHPDAAGLTPSTSGARRRRRGSRGGRKRTGTGAGSGSGAPTTGSPTHTDTDTGSPSGSPTAVAAAAPAGRNQNGGSRVARPAGAAGNVPRPKIGDSRPAPHPSAPDHVLDAPAPTGRRRGAAAAPSAAATTGITPPAIAGSVSSRRRKPRRRGAGMGDVAALTVGAVERPRGRERKGRPVGRYLMVVHVGPTATQVAVMEGRVLVEHYVSRPADDANQIDGNIYLGKVQNVLPGMEAAFVDIGTPKNAVLYRGDLRYDHDDMEAEGGGGGGKPTRGRLPGAGREMRIEQLLKAGQTVLCQVTKNPIGTKGARLTQEVSLPGRFVVLIPDSETYGISKRLPDDERKRLRHILDEIRPAGQGLIVRTAAEGASEEELSRDVAGLMREWARIEGLARKSRAPQLLYREPDLAVRVIREEFNQSYRGVVIDDLGLYEEVRDYVASISPEMADRVQYAGPETEPLGVLERFHVHEQIHKALDRKVWLPSGGSLIIERTEAMTVIDVNTGKNVGSSNLEATVYANNLEAAEEVARQLRLRDIGGIIVIDFIDMEIAANRTDVVRTLREALARDKTRTQVWEISELGLVEMTRKRISEGLVEAFSQTCPTCQGRGIVIDESLLDS